MHTRAYTHTHILTLTRWSVNCGHFQDVRLCVPKSISQLTQRSREVCRHFSEMHFKHPACTSCVKLRERHRSLDMDETQEWCFRWVFNQPAAHWLVEQILEWSTESKATGFDCCRKPNVLKVNNTCREMEASPYKDASQFANILVHFIMYGCCAKGLGWCGETVQHCFRWGDRHWHGWWSG